MEFTSTSTMSTISSLSSTTTPSHLSSQPPRKPRGLLHTLKQTLTLPHRQSPNPLYQYPDGIAVGAALRTGLLHNLRGAPSQDRNAVVYNPDRTTAMLSVFSAHGKHGSYLAEVAATVISKYIRLHGEQPCLERIADDALVAACQQVDRSPWAANSGTFATICLIRSKRLVVAACGLPFVMIVSKRPTGMIIHLLDAATVIPFASEDLESESESCTSHSQNNIDGRIPGMPAVPTIRTYQLKPRDTHVIVTTQPLWTGSSPLAPKPIVDAVIALQDASVVDLAERLMKISFGISGPTMDATILCCKLR